VIEMGNIRCWDCQKVCESKGNKCAECEIISKEKERNKATKQAALTLLADEAFMKNLNAQLNKGLEEANMMLEEVVIYSDDLKQAIRKAAGVEKDG